MRGIAVIPRIFVFVIGGDADAHLKKKDSVDPIDDGDANETSGKLCCGNRSEVKMHRWSFSQIPNTPVIILNVHNLYILSFIFNLLIFYGY